MARCWLEFNMASAVTFTHTIDAGDAVSELGRHLLSSMELMCLWQVFVQRRQHG